MSSQHNKTIFSIKEEIAAHQKQLQELEQQLSEAESQAPIYQLAIELHNVLCRANHIDDCGWFYEKKNRIDDWNGHSHRQYLKKAEAITKQAEADGLDVETAIRYYKLVRAL